VRLFAAKTSQPIRIRTGVVDGVRGQASILGGLSSIQRTKTTKFSYVESSSFLWVRMRVLVRVGAGCRDE